MARMELVMVLGNHRQAADALAQAAMQVTLLADETKRARLEADAATSSYTRMLGVLQRLGTLGWIPPNSAGNAQNGTGGGANGTIGADPVEKFAGARSRFERLQQTQEAFYRNGGAQRYGAAKEQDLKDALDRARKAQERANAPEPGMAGRMAQVLWSSRYGGAGTALGGVQPLVGRSLQAAGINPAQLTRILSNPWVAAGALVVAGATTLYKSLDSIANSSFDIARSNRVSQSLTGGNDLEVARLRSMGINPNTSRALADRLGSDPAAAMAGQSLGVSQIPGPNGTINNARNTIRLIENLRKKSHKEQERLMKQLGLEGDDSIIRQLQMSEEAFKKQADDAERENGILSRDPDYQKNAADYDAARDRVRMSNERFMKSIGNRVMGTKETQNKYADYLDKISEGLSADDPLDRFDFITRLLPLGAASIFARKALIGTSGYAGEIDHQEKRRNALIEFNREHQGTSDEVYKKDRAEFDAKWNGSGGDGHTKVDAKASATDRNSEELSKNTAGLAYLTNALGGGERSASAVPQGVGGPKGRGAALVSAYESHALTMGVM